MRFVFLLCLILFGVSLVQFDAKKDPVGTKRTEATELEIQNQNIIQSDQD